MFTPSFHRNNDLRHLHNILVKTIEDAWYHSHRKLDEMSSRLGILLKISLVSLNILSYHLHMHHNHMNYQVHLKKCRTHRSFSTGGLPLDIFGHFRNERIRIPCSFPTTCLLLNRNSASTSQSLLAMLALCPILSYVAQL